MSGADAGRDGAGSTGGTQDVLTRLLDAGRAIGGAAAGVESWRLSETELIAGLDAAYALSTQAHTVALRLLAEVDRRGLARELGAPSTTAWLTHRLRMRPGDAKRDLQVATLIDQRGSADGVEGPAPGDATRDALASGSVSVVQAGCVATGLEELPAETPDEKRLLAEGILIEQAQLQGPAALTRLGHRILERIDPEVADARLGALLEAERAQAERMRHATRYSDGHGSVWYRLRVAIGDDAWIRPVLDTLAAPVPVGADGEQDRRTAGQRLADGFVEAFRRVSLDGGLPQSGGDRPRALVTVGLDHLRCGAGVGTLVDSGDQLSVTALRQLCCDAQVIPAVLDGAGQPLDLGRARRTFDGPLRLAVIARDQGCVHPGCTRPARWCDVHHIKAWWAGGTTCLANGVLLCGFHHKIYDAGTWRLQMAPDGIPEAIPPPWIDPRGRPRRHERFLERRIAPPRPQLT